MIAVAFRDLFACDSFCTPMTTQRSLVLTGKDLSIDDLAAIARDPAIGLSIAEAAKKRVKKCRAFLEQEVIGAYKRLAKNASTEALRIAMAYGVTTGFGEFKTIRIEREDIVTLQKNILVSHATGVGENENPDDPVNYFTPEVVRAALVIRINAFLRGHSGIRWEMVQALVAMVNKGVVPLVPTRGSVGSSGDLCPLSHLFLPLVGHGRFFLVRNEAECAEGMLAALRRGAIKEGAGIAKLLGVREERLQPSYKEGLALTNGATFCAALLALGVHDARVLADTADAAAALTLEAMCGRTRALTAQIHEARGMTGQQVSAANILRLVKGSKLVDRTNEVQDVYSLRCAPQVHGASRDAIEYAAGVATAEINAATDNPLFFEELSGRMSGGGSIEKNRVHEPHAFSAGNFHGQPVGLAADFLAIAVAELANISERRTQLMLDANHSRGLPANLIANPGLNSGFMIAQYSAASLVSENKVLCHPSSVDSIPTSANSEDHVAMATTAARKALTVINNTRAVLAIELMCGAQGVEWRVGTARVVDTAGMKQLRERGYKTQATVESIRRSKAVMLDIEVSPNKDERDDGVKSDTIISSRHESVRERAITREQQFDSLYGPSRSSNVGRGAATLVQFLGGRTSANPGTAGVYFFVRSAAQAMVRDDQRAMSEIMRDVREVVAAGVIAKLVLM